HEFTVRGTNNYQGASTTGQFTIVATGSYLTVVANPAQAPVGGADPQVTVYLGDEVDNHTLDTGDYTLFYEVYDSASSRWVTSSETAMQSTPGMYRITATGAPSSEYQGISGSTVFVRNAVASSES